MQSLVYEGFVLAGFGMGTVFAFLSLLVAATLLMSGIVLKLEGESTDSHSQVIDPRTLAVITAAVHQHRRNTGN